MLLKNKVLSQENEWNYQIQYILLSIELAHDSGQTNFYLKHMLFKNKVLSQENELNYQIQYILPYIELAHDSDQINFYLTVVHLQVFLFVINKYLSAFPVFSLMKSLT